MVMTVEAWHKGFCRGIVEVFCLFPDAIMTLVLETALDASETWPLVA